MNSNTRDKLIQFIDAVEVLAQGTIHMIGVESCAKLLLQAEKLKEQLNSDETII